MGLLSLRWVFLAAALYWLARLLLFSRTAEALGAFLLFGLGWCCFSWRKARSLDSPKPR
ncbi:MAG: hypothetical protein HY927_02575 [Elusimicrobia bacterium]|nr:hypothetical protein [Elusimicrobiota bacterium]